MADAGGHEAVRRASASMAWRDRWSSLPATAIILLPVCALLLLGVPFLFRGYTGLDDRIFISAAHGVLTHGYPFETYHNAAGRPFYDHTPLFPYLMIGPALLDSLFGLHAAVIAGRLITLAFGIATVVVSYLICRDLRGPLAGVVAGVLLATNQFFVMLSWTMHMEVPMAFFLVLAIFCLIKERMLLSGLAICLAVMLKEHALAFWLVAGVYVLIARGWRPAILVTLPSAIALAAWLLAAYLIDRHQFTFVLNRWLTSAGGESAKNKRFHLTMAAWTLTIARDTIGYQLVAIPVVTAGLAFLRRAPVPRIVVVPIVYSVIAIVSSYAIHLKEPRWLIAVIPMTAIAVGLLVDWDALARWVSIHGLVRADRSAGGGGAAAAGPPSQA
jgi:predicted membrane-bound dolichyl-phosphate-mannose-protein mannosyltransferase